LHKRQEIVVDVDEYLLEFEDRDYEMSATKNEKKKSKLNISIDLFVTRRRCCTVLRIVEFFCSLFGAFSFVSFDGKSMNKSCF